MSDYVRTGGGRTVHLADCPYARTGMPWRWAKGKTLTQITQDAATLGISYRLCSRCLGASQGGGGANGR